MRKRIFRASAFFLIFLMGAALLVTLSAGPAAAAINKSVVDAAWKRVAQAAGVKPITIIYEKEESPNAWVNFKSADNYSLHVTQGLMQLLNTPDEIAGILGHEMGHVKCGHFNRGVGRSVGWSVLGALLGEVGGWAEVAGAVGMSLAEGGFSRGQEVEADDYGADAAVKAGYSPWGLYDAMKSFRDNGFITKAGITGGFNSHPPTDRRLQHLAERAQKIEPRKPAK